MDHRCPPIAAGSFDVWRSVLVPANCSARSNPLLGLFEGGGAAPPRSGLPIWIGDRLGMPCSVQRLVPFHRVGLGLGLRQPRAAPSVFEVITATPEAISFDDRQQSPFPSIGWA